IQNVASHRDALKPFVDTCRQHPRFQRLIDVGYGTDAYKVGFWRLSYYLDWKAGDEVLEKFPDKKSFRDIAEEYNDSFRALQTMDQRLAELRAEFEAGAQLERDHAEWTNWLQNIETIHLGKAREKLIDFIQGCPGGALAERFNSHPDLVMMAQRWLGLAKQARYLDEVHERTLVPLAADLQKEQQKLNKDHIKYHRPKHSYVRFPAAEVQNRFGTRRQKVQKRLERYQHTQETIYIFQDYDRGSLAEDFLWWDLMTDGSIDGDFIPEVQEFYTGHPDYRYTRRREYDDRYAAASVASSSSYDSSTSYDAS
ncbi:MAG: hypothetical protein AB1758_34665, partial [Candidatus Eremiobacterota bacterium]